MRIGLASYRCINKDLSFNMSQIERAMRETRCQVDLLCFGEAFIQGFDSLCWDYEVDRNMAIELGSEPMRRLAEWTRQYDTALLTGYIERDGESLYSSCVVIENGEILHNYRRISKGWKEYWRTDGHYLEGDTVGSFRFRDKTVTLALCGDMWDCQERFKTDGLLIWPVYVNFTVGEWEERELPNYAKQAQSAANDVLMVNPIDIEEENHGGSFRFQNGKIAERTAFDREEILVVDLGE